MDKIDILVRHSGKTAVENAYIYTYALTNRTSMIREVRLKPVRRK